MCDLVQECSEAIWKAKIYRSRLRGYPTAHFPTFWIASKFDAIHTKREASAR